MREYRTGYFAAPHGADRLRELGNVATRVDVAVRHVSTGTNKAMLRSFSDFPAHATCLRRVGLVSNKVLKLTERPTMQSRPNPLPGLDVGADVGQVFHADFSDIGIDSFCNDGLANFVVHMFHMQAFTPRDSAQLAFRCAATVGLKSPAVGKVFVAVVPQLPTTEHLASAGCGETIFPNINAHRAATGRRRSIGNVENEVEVPDTLADNQLCFLRGAAGKQVTLMLAANERNLGATLESEKGKHVALDRVGALVKVDGSWAKSNCRNGLVLGDAFVGLKRFVGVCYTVNGLANHLATEGWHQFPHSVVSVVMQDNPVPTAMLDRERNYRIARHSKLNRQSRQRGRLVGGCKQFQRYGAFHIGDGIMLRRRVKRSSTALLSLPALKGEVSRSKI
jgi:hypothetical protein